MNDTKILIIEDDKPLRRALADKFSREGYKIIEAENGKIGLDLALESQPDIILLDIVMPVMDGITMLMELRKDDWGKKAEVLVLSNLSEGTGIAEAMKNNVYSYLIKSDWKIEDVVKEVERRLSK